MCLFKRNALYAVHKFARPPINSLAPKTDDRIRYANSTVRCAREKRLKGRCSALPAHVSNSHLNYLHTHRHRPISEREASPNTPTRKNNKNGYIRAASIPLAKRRTRSTEHRMKYTSGGVVVQCAISGEKTTPLAP